MRRRGSFISVLIFLLASQVSLAAEESWEPALKVQLQSEKNCDLSYLTNAKTYRKDSREVVEARAHCTDGRSFDVIKPDTPLKFEINECGLQVC